MGLDDVMNPPSATGGVTQADPESIARGLVGDALVDKFGHAMGVRPTTPADVLRDTYLGMTVGPANVTKMQAQAQKALQDEHARSLAQGIAERQARRQKMDTMIAGLKTVMDPKLVPLNQRARVWSNLMTAAGYPPDKDVVAMLTDKTDPESRKNMEALLKAAPNMDPDEFGANQQSMDAYLEQKKGLAVIEASKASTANAVVNRALAQKRLEAPAPERKLTYEERKYEDLKSHLDTTEVTDVKATQEMGKRVTRQRTQAEKDAILQANNPRAFARTHETAPVSSPDAPLFGAPAAAPPAEIPFLATPPAQQEGKDLSIPNVRGVIQVP